VLDYIYAVAVVTRAVVQTVYRFVVNNSLFIQK